MNRRSFLGRLAGAFGAAALVVHGYLGEMIPVPKEPEVGANVRSIRAFDPAQDKFLTRMDVLYGFGMLHADQCVVRIMS